ncbi:Uncharacterised protein [Enterobacter cloacae]|nr:Uncharacterised protein [Enterobacter cloacae]
MVFTSSYGAEKLFTLLASIQTEPLRSTLVPNWPSNFMVVSISFSFGTFWISTGSSASSAAKRMGSAAFLAPEIVTSPWRRVGPCTRNLSIVCSLINSTVLRAFRPQLKNRLVCDRVPTPVG